MNHKLHWKRDRRTKVHQHKSRELHELNIKLERGKVEEEELQKKN